MLNTHNISFDEKYPKIFFLSTLKDYLFFCTANTVKPVLSDHIKQDIFWHFRQVVAYC